MSRSYKKGKYGQAFAGADDLGYPFNVEGTQTRTGLRQAVVDQYAESCLPGTVHRELKSAGCKWLPKDADKISRLTTSENSKGQARQFIAAMYICDLAHAVTAELKREASSILARGQMTPEAMARIAGIVSNITNQKFTDEGDFASLRRRLETFLLNHPPGPVPVNDDDRNTVRRPNDAFGAIQAVDQAADQEQQEQARPLTPSDLMYPVSYTLKKVGSKAVLSLADDLFLFRLLKALRSSKIDTANFSLSTRIKVFMPLGLDRKYGTAAGIPNKFSGFAEDDNTGYPQYRSALTRLIAESIDEVALEDSTMSKAASHGYDAVKLGINEQGQDPAQLARGEEIQLMLEEGSTTLNNSRVSINSREEASIRAAMMDILHICKNVIAQGSGVDGDVLDPTRVPYLLSSDSCPEGHQPIFYDAFNRPVQPVLTSNGWRAHGAVSFECVPRESSSQRKASQGKASQGKASQVSLRQVEALPKKELAKFVQRIVNM